MATFDWNWDNPVATFNWNWDNPVASFDWNGDYPVGTFVNPICIRKFTQIFSEMRRRILLKKKNVPLYPDYEKLNEKIHWKL